MSTKRILAAVAVVGLTVPATPSLAMTGAGCPDLPEYYRAVGTIEMGPGTCGMTMEEARRILARGNPDAPQQPAAAPAPVRHRHHQRVAPQT